MPAKQPPKLRVFGENETIDENVADAEELDGGESGPSGQQPTPEPPSGEPEGTPPQQLDSTQQDGEPRGAEKRIKQLLERENALRQQLAESNERWARLDERRRQVEEARQAADNAARQQREAAQRPDPSIDPVGAELWDTKKALRDLTEWRQQQEQTLQQIQGNFQQVQQQNDFYNWINYEAQNYSRTQPDYYDAARYAAEKRMEWWQELGLPPDHARQMVLNESNLIAAMARQTGKSFAPVVYKIAQQWGYQSRNGNGAAAKPTSAAASAAGRTLAQVAKGQAMQGLNRVPAAGNEGQGRYLSMSAGEIANISDAQWQRDWANPALRAEMQLALNRLEGLPDDFRG